ncbi:hypothetical protein ACTJJ0_25460 [Chitinophaga sp. 22321]|uniref:Uncharacterized protein n=1 Tax=Chitinophaga hostae TaxID=2831022 RepID=A0ABS5J5L1_9BACT|nr:hypothetical protein [Chitinophaga hostae]MBS0030464.1 hypothetical protein [Chitinophaga hostae]
MKIIFTLLCASFFLLFLSHCRKGGSTMRGYFWTRKNNGPYYLYINDTLKGTLPYQEQPPKCGDPDLDQKTRFVLLTSSTHYIEVRDQQGKTLLLEKYELEKNEHHFSLSVSMKTPNGRNQHVISGNCSVEEIGF